MRMLAGLLATILLTACAPSRVLSRPSGEVAAGETWLAGRLTIEGLEAESWEDPLQSAFGRAFLLAVLRDANGQTAYLPCRSDGSFLCNLPTGHTQLVRLIAATSQGLLADVKPATPLALDLNGRAIDMGRVHWQVVPRQQDQWQATLASEAAGVKRLNVTVRPEFLTDPSTYESLASLVQSAETIAREPRAERARLDERFDELLVRWGL